MDKKLATLILAGGGVLLLVGVAQSSGKESPNLKVTRWDDEIFNASRHTGVSPAMIAAVIEVESGGTPTVTGGSGEFGLMQIMCATAEQVGFSGDCQNLFIPKINILYGAKYLAWQLKRYNGNIEQVFSAYNAGTATARNRSYVEKAVAAHRRYTEYY